MKFSELTKPELDKIIENVKTLKNIKEVIKNFIAYCIVFL